MKEELKKFVDAVEITNIWLKNSSSSCNIYPLSIDPAATQVVCQFDSRYSYMKDLSLMICYVKSFVKGIEEEGTKKEEEIFRLENEFVLVYKTQKFKTNPSDEMLRKFLDTTALFNSIPFHREQVQGQTSKMGIPSVVIPLFRPGQEVTGSIVDGKKLPQNKKVTKKKSKKVAKKVVKKVAKKKSTTTKKKKS